MDFTDELYGEGFYSNYGDISGYRTMILYNMRVTWDFGSHTNRPVTFEELQDLGLSVDFTLVNRSPPSTPIPTEKVALHNKSLFTPKKKQAIPIKRSTKPQSKKSLSTPKKKQTIPVKRSTKPKKKQTIPIKRSTKPQSTPIEASTKSMSKLIRSPPKKKTLSELIIPHIKPSHVSKNGQSMMSKKSKKGESTKDQQSTPGQSKKRSHLVVPHKVQHTLKKIHSTTRPLIANRPPRQRPSLSKKVSNIFK
jgi:hypothetical protein